jgi:hypothetical protein
VEAMMEITIKNGYGVEMTIKISEDATLSELLERISVLVHSAGYAIGQLPDAYRNEAVRLENEIDIRYD